MQEPYGIWGGLSESERDGLLRTKKRQLTLTLNGTKTADVNNGFFEEGHFTLQWGDGVVKFRKVAVKPL